jgi:hypothetical protein
MHKKKAIERESRKQRPDQILVTAQKERVALETKDEVERALELWRRAAG